MDRLSYFLDISSDEEDDEDFEDELSSESEVDDEEEEEEIVSRYRDFNPNFSDEQRYDYSSDEDIDDIEALHAPIEE